MSEICTPARPFAHEEHIPGSGTFRVRALDPTVDCATIHAWAGQERAAFWGMNDLTLDQITEIYRELGRLTTHHAFMVEKDDEPVALLQTYEPEADRVSECYEVRPGDIGIHLLLAPAGPEGSQAGWTASLSAVIATYVLRGLDRQRVVTDPDVRNQKAISRLLRQGFVAGPVVVLPEVDLPEVHLPEKHAQLAFLPREAVFPDGS
ncbi:GNAT family N-acetyltransferase [Streptomyces sp. NPDC005385]|uniref:GNAT family N-acetyltransferase n=1 Tax=Streptomyces sp. NPDC005385 TaxID=3157039 RepID=UPI0033B00FDF